MRCCDVVLAVYENNGVGVVCMVELGSRVWLKLSCTYLGAVDVGYRAGHRVWLHACARLYFQARLHVVRGA